MWVKLISPPLIFIKDLIITLIREHNEFIFLFLHDEDNEIISCPLTIKLFIYINIIKNTIKKNMKSNPNIFKLYIYLIVFMINKLITYIFSLYFSSFLAFSIYSSKISRWGCFFSNLFIPSSKFFNYSSDLCNIWLISKQL